jgi:hypothetical protein
MHDRRLIAALLASAVGVGLVAGLRPAEAQTLSDMLARKAQKPGDKEKDKLLVESKELVGSAFVIEAADMEDAVRVASLHPATQVLAGEPFGWGLEIRPIHYFKTLETPEVTWQPPAPAA